MGSKFSSVQENLYFLLSELEKQTELVETLFNEAPSTDLLKRIQIRQGYSNTLCEKVENECTKLKERRKSGTQYFHEVSALGGLAVILSEYSMLCLETIRETSITEEVPHPAQKDCAKLVRRLKRALMLAKIGLSNSQRRTGLKLIRRSAKYLDLHQRIQSTTMEQPNQDTRSDVQAYWITNYLLKRLCMHIEKVGEALIQADVGPVATVKNYPHLKRSSANLASSLDDLALKRLALTRSGSAIASLSHRDSKEGDVLAVFKEGEQQKIEEELQGVEKWRRIAPKMAPKVISHIETDTDNSALLIEHLNGVTLESILFEGSSERLQKTFKILFSSLEKIWKKTLTYENPNTTFMGQLSGRLADCQSIHPDFFHETQTICGVKRLGFGQLISQVESLERHWNAPFSVLIHGDFNVDNLLFDELESQFYFIDLHRSRHFDYVQDLSVLMISIYRLQGAPKKTRAVMMACILEIYKFGRRFAQKQQDPFFEVRLAAGLARSFATSTRFVYDKKQAKKMYLKSRFLLEQLARETADTAQNYRIPLKELYFD